MKLCLLLLIVSLLPLAFSNQGAMADAGESAPAGPPPCPIVGDMDLALRPLDFIDCADADDPHEFLDQGTSSVVVGPAGRYRQTAAHRHAFFAYKFRSAGKDKPVLIVFEYPDDAVRTINFSTHESGLSGRTNIDWSLETGVYTGDPMPLSGKMQHHTFIMWPQEDEPSVIVGNFHRYGHPAAAARIWVYAIEKPLPKLDVPAPDPANQRQLGHFNSLGTYLPIRLYFGLRSPNSIEHMLDYYQYIGVNEVSWPVVTNAGIWFDCFVEAWGGDPKKTDNLKRTLEAMDKRGGFSFVAGFNMGGGFKFGDKTFDDLDDEQLLALLKKGFDEFFDRYGRYASLKKIALGAQYQIGFFDYLNRRGLTQEVVDAIKARRPDIQVLTYIGGRTLHAQYFDGKAFGDAQAPTTGEVVAQWEAAETPWSDFLGEKALEVWRLWKHDPAEFRKIRGLTVYDQYQPDDHRIFGLYAQEPRAMIYHDLDRSARRDALIDTNYAAMWNTHFEGRCGLHPEVNFWNQKLWVAPDFNAPPPRSMASFARIMGHRDRLAITPGSWNNKYFGYETAVRRFAKAFRSLPPEPMTDVADLPLDTVAVRWLRYNGRRHVAVQSLIPFAGEVDIDGKTVALGPYELVALADDGRAAPAVSGTAPVEYVEWVGGRIALMEALIEEVRAMDPAAAGEAFSRTAAEAATLLAADKPRAADLTAGNGLINELQLRKDILDRPKLAAPRMPASPVMEGDLDAWPAGTSNLIAAGGEYLAGHLYFPTSWSGPADLSARLRLGHDGATLYVGAEIRDDLLTDKDACTFRLSTNGAYKNWRAAAGRSDVSWPITLPDDDQTEIAGKGARGFRYTCRRTDTGYVVEGAAPLAELGLEPGGRMGFLLFCSDDDDTPNLYRAGWARKQALLLPHKPNFAYYSDVRTCGELVLGE